MEKRTVDELGRIVLPATFREKLGIKSKDVMDITCINDDTIMLKKDENIQHCDICRTTDNVRELTHTSEKHYICSECIKAVNKLK